jgi:MFS family permease
MTWRSPFNDKAIVVSALGITQTLAWGSTYYLTAVFSDPVSAGLHLSRTWFYGSVSAALLLSGLLGPLAGRTIDRYGGRDVLAATNLVFAAGLVLLSFADGPAGLGGLAGDRSRHGLRSL